jgi:hypothetical protein
MSTSTRIWLNVPFDEKDAAKDAGARWDAQHKCWYAPDGLTSELAPWSETSSTNQATGGSVQLVGEDRHYSAFAAALYVDLVPRSCWCTNVRSNLTASAWQRLSRHVRTRVDHTCEACGETPPPRKLHAHERFSFDEQRNVQRLERLMALCAACHDATHIGHANVHGRSAAAIDQLMRVNEWTRPQLDAHITDAYAVWERRSVMTWTLDLSILTAFAAPPEPLQVVSARSLPDDVHEHVRERLPALRAALPHRACLIMLEIHPDDAGAIVDKQQPCYTDEDGSELPILVTRGCPAGQLQVVIDLT